MRLRSFVRSIFFLDMGKSSVECFYCVNELGFGIFIFDLLNALCVNIDLLSLVVLCGSVLLCVVFLLLG